MTPPGYPRLISARDELLEYPFLLIGGRAEHTVEMHVNIASRQLGDGPVERAHRERAVKLAADRSHVTGEAAERPLALGRDPGAVARRPGVKLVQSLGDAAQTRCKSRDAA
jgi:hypothetical protein